MRFPSGIVIFSLFFSFCFHQLFAEVITVEGTYQGQNVLIQNPQAETDKTYCIKEIVVNGLQLRDIDKHNLEVDLSSYKIGEYIEINIQHKKNCLPLILNPNVLMSKSTCYFVTVRADKKSVKWTANNETTQEPFIIEQHKYNKWSPIGKVTGRGPEGYNNYVFPVKHYSGMNRYRIKQRDVEKGWVYSEPLEFFNQIKQVEFFPARVDRVIYFTEKTDYEIYSIMGALMKKGEASQVVVEDLPPDAYYLNFDNRTEKFLKK